LSRDVRIAETLFHEFAKLGVEILIAGMPTYNGRDRKDVLIRQIREAIAEENRKDIIDRLWKDARNACGGACFLVGMFPMDSAEPGKSSRSMQRERKPSSGSSASLLSARARLRWLPH